jgi:hypothetical protein
MRSFRTPSKIRMMKFIGKRLRLYLARVKKRNTYMTLVGKPEGKTLLERLRHMWMDNIKMNLREIGVVWTD